MLMCAEIIFSRSCEEEFGLFLSPFVTLKNDQVECILRPLFVHAENDNS